MKKALVTIVLLGGMAVVVWYTLRSGATPEGSFNWSGSSAMGITTAKVTRELLAMTVSAAGSIVPADEAFVVSPLSEKVVEVKVEEGRQVAFGETLFVLDKTKIQGRIDISKAQLKVVEAQVAEAQIAKEGASRRIDEARRPYTPKLEQADSAISMKQVMLADRDAELARAEKDYKWKKSLWSHGTITGVDYIAAEAAYKRALGAVEAAKQDLESSKKSKDALAAEIEDHVSALQRDLKAVEAKETTAQERIAEMKLSLAQAESDLAGVNVTAPIAGVVLNVRVRVAEIPPSGFVPSRDNAQVVIADLSHLFVEAEVDERDVFVLELKDKAAISLDAMPDKTFHGSVSRIARMASRSSRNTDIPVFKIRIAVESPGEQLRPGLSAKVEITVSEKADAVQVPIAAIVERNAAEVGIDAGDDPADAAAAGRGYVKVAFVLVGSHAEARKVTLGLATESKVEVLSGLKEGDEVITGPYRLLTRLKNGEPLK
ncbi:MAG: efflux RND transporter periplasmic adaptor subunit [Planctomycetota bacterium]|nr:efflux RND transporter periplasmic adaptor subunit [Planctomycetota bacterium]